MEKKITRGYVREDGMIYARKNSSSKTGELWLTPEKWQKFLEKEQAYWEKKKTQNKRSGVSRPKRGFARDDGKIYWGVHAAYLNNEQWMEPVAFKARIKKDKDRRVKMKQSMPSERPLSRGDIHPETGKIFFNYDPTIRGGEAWLSPEKFKARMIVHNAQARKQYAKDPRRILDTNKNWRIRNPEKAGEIAASQRARRRGAIPKNHDIPLDRTLKILCRLLAPIDVMHIDHIIPLSRGGVHERKNLRILTRRLNCQKQERLDGELPSDQMNGCIMWTGITGLLVCSYETYLK